MEKIKLQEELSSKRDNEIFFSTLAQNVENNQGSKFYQSRQSYFPLGIKYSLKSSFLGEKKKYKSVFQLLFSSFAVKN